MSRRADTPPKRRHSVPATATRILSLAAVAGVASGVAVLDPVEDADQPDAAEPVTHHGVVTDAVLAEVTPADLLAAEPALRDGDGAYTSTIVRALHTPRGVSPDVELVDAEEILAAIEGPPPAPEPITQEASTEPASTDQDTVWDRLAQCESSGDWHIDTGNGFYGGLQFTLQSWQWVGGTGYPHDHPRDVQIRKAERLLERQGWIAWPACSRQLGLR